MIAWIFWFHLLLLLRLISCIFLFDFTLRCLILWIYELLNVIVLLIWSIILLIVSSFWLLFLGFLVFLLAFICLLLSQEFLVHHYFHFLHFHGLLVSLRIYGLSDLMIWSWLDAIDYYPSFECCWCFTCFPFWAKIIFIVFHCFLFIFLILLTESWRMKRASSISKALEGCWVFRIYSFILGRPCKQSFNAFKMTLTMLYDVKLLSRHSLTAFTWIAILYRFLNTNSFSNINPFRTCFVSNFGSFESSQYFKMIQIFSAATSTHLWEVRFLLCLCETLNRL